MKLLTSMLMVLMVTIPALSQADTSGDVCVLTVYAPSRSPIVSTYSCDGRTPSPLTPISSSGSDQELSGQLGKFLARGMRLTSCAAPSNTWFVCTLVKN